MRGHSKSNVSPACSYALTASGHGHENQVVVSFNGAAANGLSNELAVEIHKGYAQLVILVNLVHRTDVMVGGDQMMSLLQLQYFVNLTGIDQTVATHEELIIAEVRRVVVEVANGYQVTAFHIEQPGLAQRLADVRVVRGYP